MTEARRRAASRCVFWSTVWLMVALVGAKAAFLGGLPPAPSDPWLGFLRSLAAISYADVLFAAGLWITGRAAIAVVGRRPRVARLAAWAFAGAASLCSLYAVAGLVIFGVMGGFLTWPLLSMVGSVLMLRSSVEAHLAPATAAGLIAIPLAHLALVGLTLRLPSPTGPGARRLAVAFAGLCATAWVVLGQQAYATQWSTRQERRVAENPHWVFAASVWQAGRRGGVRLGGDVAVADLADFEPPVLAPVATAGTTPTNVILIVLESVARRWTSLAGLYETTPHLVREAARSLVFESFYAHTGRSSNSLASILLSVHPKLGFRDLTQEYPRRPGSSIAQLFKTHGYETAFVTASDLRWAGWDRFLEGRGFRELRDQHDLACGEPLSSWGVEDRCMIEDLLGLARRFAARPFFLMGWSQQTHHPYEPGPAVPVLEFAAEPVPDSWGLSRYLTVLRETDRHLGRLFEGLRRSRLDRNTLVVITGDHGQAFGYPHRSFMQGRTIYEEDVNVPLMLWAPSRYQAAQRSRTLGSHVDLGPTIADLAGVPPAADWQGRSLIGGSDERRAYFYVADDEFTLGVREGNWKYILDLRSGTEELYDLERDALEQTNLAGAHPDRSARLRRRLVAWTEANRRQYEVLD